MANEQDALFVNQVVRSNVAEITEGNLAVQHSPELAVNEFGRWMVTDHTAMNAMLTTEASEACLPVPTDLSPEQQAEVNTLSQLSGTDFDRAYVSAQVSDHEATLALLRQEVSGGEDPNLISLAQSSIPIVQAHLDEAQILTGIESSHHQSSDNTTDSGKSSTCADSSTCANPAGHVRRSAAPTGQHVCDH